MSGFFSIDGRPEQHHQTESSTTNLFLSSSSRNVELYNKGLEIWQQYYQFHQQRFQQHNTQDLNFCSGDSSSSRRPNHDNVNIVVDGGDIGDEHSDYGYYRSSAGISRAAMMDQGGSSFEGFNCQDCGNRAKKDCAHMRCRTCCKSRGFQCPTHVRSTWVPAAKRRERHQLGSSELQHNQQQQVAVGEDNRKQITTGGAGGSGGGGFELGQFPPEVHSSADFTLVRVSSIDGAEEHLAYQTAVSIGGHLFKGILYDRGPQGRGGTSSQQQVPADPTAATSTSAVATTSGLTNPAIMDPSIYPAQLSGFMAGTQFFMPPRP